jgi:hypothetical protein
MHVDYAIERDAKKRATNECERKINWEQEGVRARINEIILWKSFRAITDEINNRSDLREPINVNRKQMCACVWASAA